MNCQRKEILMVKETMSFYKTPPPGGNIKIQTLIFPLEGVQNCLYYALFQKLRLMTS